jgi:hypothetical protein
MHFIKFPLLFFMMLFVTKASAQNLVPNPSFENFILCTGSPDNIYYLADWFTCNNASPDYFNSCSNPSDVGVPENIAGYQVPVNGQAYTGIISYGADVLYREIIGVELQSPLVVGEKYFISGYFSKGDSTSWSDCSSNNLGFQFSNVGYDVSNQVPIDNRSVLKFDSILFNSSTWTRLTGSFVADSAYQYLMVGNFYDDQHTLFVCGDGVPYAYYFIDAICVSSDSTFNENWIGINSPELSPFKISAYPNPANKIFSVKGLNNNLEIPYQLYSIENKLMELGKISGNKNTINCEYYPDGVYILRMQEKNLSIVIKH